MHSVVYNLVDVMSNNLSWLVGMSIQDEAVDVVRSAPQRAHYHTGVIYLFFFKLGIRKEAIGLWYPGLGYHPLDSRSTFFKLRWTASPGLELRVRINLPNQPQAIRATITPA